MLPGSPYGGECWALEAELTPKPLARTTAIMTTLVTRATDYYPGAEPGTGPRYDRVVYRARLPSGSTPCDGKCAGSVRPAS